MGSQSLPRASSDRPWATRRTALASIGPLHCLTDAELRDEMLDGSSAAAEALFRRYYATGVRCARALGAEGHLANDLASEAFIRLWQRLEGPEPIRSVGAYLRMVVRHLYVDHVRRPAPLLMGLWTDRDDPLPGDFTDAVVLSDAVGAVLDCLSDRHRRILELTAIRGLSLAEAAEAMGLPSPGAAAVLAHRARLAARAIGFHTD